MKSLFSHTNGKESVRFENHFFVLTADILQANDSLTQVINQYRQLVKGEDVTKDGITVPSQAGKRMCVSVSTLTAENSVEV